MASRIWEWGLVLSLVFTGLASVGTVRVSSSDVAVCPAASPVNSILQLPDLCSDSDPDPIGAMEVYFSFSHSLYCFLVTMAYLIFVIGCDVGFSGLKEIFVNFVLICPF